MGHLLDRADRLQRGTIDQDDRRWIAYKRDVRRRNLENLCRQMNRRFDHHHERAAVRPDLALHFHVQVPLGVQALALGILGR